MKRIRQVVRQRIQKAQKSQKYQYDKHVKESKIEVGDLVMLRVEPTFKLDRTFRGPYRVHNVTSTCAGIQPINSRNEETIFVSLQRLSRCHASMLENIKPWLGQGKKRRRRRVRPRADANDPVTVPRTDTDESTTRSGRVVRKPLRYRVGYSSCPGRTASQQGEVVRNVIRESLVIIWWGKKCEHADLRLFCNYCRDSVITLCIVFVTVSSRCYHK